MKRHTLLLFAAICICLIQVWLPEYFLTGDGAVHVYNAALLKDKWLGLHQSFYSGFYFFNTEIDPNWFSHIVLAALLLVFSGAVAEKLLLTLYILCYATGFAQINRLSGGNKYLAVAGTLLIINHTLVKGFYNFNISVALSLWMVAAWLLFLRKGGFKNLVVFILLSSVTFLAHATGFAFGVVLCAVFTTFIICGTEEGDFRYVRFELTKKLSILALCVLPFVILIWQYSSRHTPSSGIELHPERWGQLLMFPDYQTHTAGESVWGRVVAYALLVVFVLSLCVPFFRDKLKWKHLAGTAFLAVMFTTYMYMPAEAGGGSMMDIRGRQLVLLSVAIGLTTLPVKNRFAMFSGVLLFTLLAVLSFVRLPVLVRAGDGAAEYVSVTKGMKPKSTLLPLSFNHNGTDFDGSDIVNRNWVFQHAIGYAGTEKPLVIMDNYAANTYFFPFIWHPEKNPYYQLNASPGYEDERPYADIPHYEQVSGHSIDYIVTWCYDPSFRSIAHVDTLFMYIEENYDLAAVSADKRALLYERKTNR